MGFEKRIAFIIILAALLLVYVNAWTAKPYFGKWQIDSIIGHESYYSPDRVSMGEKGGLVLNLSVDQAHCPNYEYVKKKHKSDPILKVRNPVYEDRIISDAEFSRYFRLSLERIGVEQKEILAIFVREDRKTVSVFFYDEKKDQVIVEFNGIWLSTRRLK